MLCPREFFFGMVARSLAKEIGAGTRQILVCAARQRVDGLSRRPYSSQHQQSFSLFLDNLLLEQREVESALWGGHLDKG